MGKVVEVIPAKPMHQIRGQELTAKLRVCAYCRVSTDNEEQLGSFDAQVKHYTSFIQNNPEWEYVGIYADEGISATSTKKRVEFNRMIEHCMEGKIDMVITKSISRFARNTVDCLNFARQLKAQNIAIFFEKENVNTLDSKGDFMLTLLGSLAQEESNSISQASRQGIVYRFQEGKVRVNHSKFLGYTKDEDGELTIDPKQAETVMRIFTEYLEGASCKRIADGLQNDGVLTGSGGDRWYESTIRKILQNEKYMGDALLQKTYTVDFLSKKRVVNEGHVPKYYVEDSHPAIVTKEMFGAVQAEMKRRSSLQKPSKIGKSCYAAKYPFSGRLVCSACGAKLTRKQWGKDKFVWMCINHMKNGVKACSQKAVKEILLEQAFVRVVNKVVGGKDTFMKKLLVNIENGLNEKINMQVLEKVDGRLFDLQKELIAIARVRAQGEVNDSVYSKEYQKISSELDRLRERRNEIKAESTGDSLRRESIREFVEYLRKSDSPLEAFSGELFTRLIERVDVADKARLVFVFKTGIEVTGVLF